MATKEIISLPAQASASYEVIIGTEVSAGLGGVIKDKLDPRRVTVVSNPEIWDIAGEKITSALEEAEIYFDLIAIPEGESHKTLESVELVYEALTDAGATRSDPLIAVGGGVVGDLAGFAAATFMRGVPFINVPTTYLAMIDSSIGGKTGVDLPAGKNLVGAFHQPLCVLSDVDFLKTLPDRELRCGVAEAIKTAFLAGEKFFSYIDSNIEKITSRDAAVLSETIRSCVRYKGDIIADDPLDDNGNRAVLNYGHTFGHALETESGYQDINHGEAVAFGMVFAAKLSSKLGICRPELENRTVELLEKAGLETNLKMKISDNIIGIMKRDKKNYGDSARFVLLEDIGKPVLRDIAWSYISALLKEM